MAYKLGCSVRTIEEDTYYLKIEPTADERGTNLYSQQDFELIGQLREHCKNKANTRENFVPNKKVEVLDIEPKVTKLNIAKNKALDIDKYQKAIELGLEQDPLFDLEILERIASNKWLIPTQKLALLFNLSRDYLTRKGKYYYCGFLATKKTYVNGHFLWEVTKNNI